MSVGGSAEVFIPLQLKRLDFHVVTERPTEQKRPNFPVPLFMLVFRCCLVRAVPFKRARELYCPPRFQGYCAVSYLLGYISASALKMHVELFS